MSRSYEYKGFTLELSVEIEVSIRPAPRALAEQRYVAVVSILKEGIPIAIFSPLRFGDMRGRPFANEADALMGGYSAACKIVDDLFSQSGQ